MHIQILHIQLRNAKQTRDVLLVGKEKPGYDNLRNFYLMYLNIRFAVNQSPQQGMLAARQTPCKQDFYRAS